MDRSTSAAGLDPSPVTFCGSSTSEPLLTDAGAGLSPSSPTAEQLDHLFRKHAPRLFRFFLRHTREREDAADLVQDAFARIARLQPAAEPRNLDAYLQRVAANLIKDRFRRHSTRPLHCDLSGLELADPGADPERSAQTQELLRAFETALQALSPRTREVFLRHRLAGEPYKAIASATGLSVSSVEKHMMKAIAHIDRKLDRR